jgi:hypothetical protein
MSYFNSKTIKRDGWMDVCMNRGFKEAYHFTTSHINSDNDRIKQATGSGT